MKPKSVVDACRRNYSCPLILAIKRKKIKTKMLISDFVGLGYNTCRTKSAAKALKIHPDYAEYIAELYDNGKKLAAAEFAISIGLF